VALYETLGEDDLYFRFFQARTPPLHTIEAMTSVGQRDGFRWIAEITDRDGNRRIVGECGYELLADGNGELAITVAPDARGWLGPYMLDALLEVAASRGIPNLEADVLSENRQMLALLCSRGYATMDHSSTPMIVRAVIGTTRRVPSWPPRDDRPRVLVEIAGGRWHAEAAARAAGLQVVVCPGPLAKWSHCPALAGRPCPLAEGADLTVDAVAPASATGQALLESHRRLHPGVPLCVELAPGTRGLATGPPQISHETEDDTVVKLLRLMARPRSLPPG
jgi:hypothetical protein